MNWTSLFNQRDLELVRDALRVIVDGPWISSRGFISRIGVERAQMVQMATEWPSVPISPEVVTCVRAAVLEVAMGIRFRPGEEAEWLRVDRGVYKVLLDRIDELWP